MPVVLGNAIALGLVLALVCVCVRALRRDRRRGGCGSCAGACGGCGGACAGCGKCGLVPTDGVTVADVERLRKI